MRKTVLAAAVSIMATPAIAMDAEGKFSNLGSGTMSCGSWIAELQNRSLGSQIQKGWVMGYLTGYNQFKLTGASDITARTDHNGVFAAITNHCTANPLDNLRQAVTAVITQLRDQLRAQ